MKVQHGDLLLHNNGVVYQVKSIEKSPHGGVRSIRMLNYQTKQVDEFNPSVLDTYFKPIDNDMKADVVDQGLLGPGDYDNLRAVRQEYSEWISQYAGKPPKHDEAYTNAELKAVLSTDNTVALYQLAMELERTITGLRYDRRKASDFAHPEHWESWTEKGVPGNKTFWQIQTVVKDMGGMYNTLLDSKPDLEVRL